MGRSRSRSPKRSRRDRSESPRRRPRSRSPARGRERRSRSRSGSGSPARYRWRSRSRSPAKSKGGHSAGAGAGATAGRDGAVDAAGAASGSGAARERSRSRSKSPSRLSKRERKAERERLRKEQAKRKAEKQRAKADETPEEKIARRLAKKKAKDATRTKAEDKEKAQFAGYTNGDNPFGDKDLGSQFSWAKKTQALSAQGMSVKEQKDRAQQLKVENAKELEKVKAARALREVEMEEAEKEKEADQRAKEDELFASWMNNEEDFHMEQARLRSEIRLKDGRGKPIDILANYIHNAGDADAPESEMANMAEPYAIFAGLSIEDVEDLHEDIKVYKQMEQDSNEAFWEDLQKVAEYELEKKNRKLPPAVRRALDIGITRQVEEQIVELMRKKSVVELERMQSGIRVKVEAESRVGGVDLGYWERMVVESDAALAKARLREMHQHYLEDKLSILREKAEAEGGSGGGSAGAGAGAGAGARDGSGDEDSSGDEIIFDEEDLLAIEEGVDEGLSAEAAAAALALSIEPPLLPLGERGVLGLLDPAADLLHLQKARRRVLIAKRKKGQAKFARQNSKGGAAVITPGTGEGRTYGETEEDTHKERGNFMERAFMRQYKKEKMEADETEFSTEVKVRMSNGDQAKMAMWREKHKPRKPRYFNRVHTGFEWNRYNQTHYDGDNPPPKIVQGYKFNLFYPDLVNPHKTPDFTLTPIPGEEGFATLKFSGGPPYEDIAFKVVDRKWEYGHRRGFRSEFRNNVLQLWFHFQRERYRR